MMASLIVLSLLLYKTLALPSLSRTRYVSPFHSKLGSQNKERHNLRSLKQSKITKLSGGGDNVNNIDIEVDALVVGSGLTGCSHAFHLVHNHNVESVLMCEKRDEVKCHKNIYKAFSFFFKSVFFFSFFFFSNH